MSDMVRLSVNLSPDVAAALKEIADTNGISITEAIRRAIATEKFVQDTTRAGGKLLVEDEDKKTLRQLVFR